jgi:hypothetical protein
MGLSREQVLEKVRTLGGGYWYRTIDLGQRMETAPDDQGGDGSILRRPRHIPAFPDGEKAWG